MVKHNVIWYSFALLFLCILVLTISVSGQEIQVSPEFIEIDLRGGEYNTTILTVKWTGSDTIQCFISTNITSDCPGNDSEGIDVTYSELSPFNLPPKVDYTVNMTIKVAPNLMPGVYIITTNFSCEADQPPPSPRPYYPSPPNIPPVASAGEKYTGYPNQAIMFNGSLSYDPDGEIVSWFWDFGDGTNGVGETTTHSYSNPGTYSVALTVTDDEGAEDTYETTVEIMTANRPPTKPVVNGTKTGRSNIKYTYTAISTDPDNDTIKYTFNWGDNTSDSSGFLKTAFSVSHIWGDAGRYLIEIFATDNQSTSVSEFTVLIDSRYCGYMGIIIDNDSDGIYDLFYCNETGNTTILGRENGVYLIDSDNDGIWDYEYNPETNMLVIYTPSEEKDYSLYALVFLIILILIGISLWYGLDLRKKEKKKKKKKKRKNNK